MTPSIRRFAVRALAVLAACVGLFALGRLGLSAAAHRGPPRAPALELRLELAGTRLRETDFPFYRLEVENVGSAAAAIHDPFWVDQGVQATNWERRRGTYFQIVGPKGEEVFLGRQFDFHGVTYHWTNDRSLYVPPKRRGVRGLLTRLLERGIISPRLFWPLFQGFMEKWHSGRDAPVLLLKPGERFSATPSAMKSVDPFREASSPPPSGYRVLERYAWGLKPGRYRIKAVYDTRFILPPLSAAEQIAQWDESRDGWKGSSRRLFVRDAVKKWAAVAPAELRALRDRRREVEEVNRFEVRVESNAVDFEVVR